MNGDVKKEKTLCICSFCRKRFPYEEADTVQRMLYNVQIEEKKCPYCGSKAFSPLDQLYFLNQMSSHHQADGKRG